MAVVVPHGVLFRGGAEAKIRKQLIEENLLDTVIGLPKGLFFGTDIQATILVLKRNKKNNDVLFIGASQDFEAGNPQNKLRPRDVKKILSSYHKRKSLDKYAYVAKYEEIKENEFNLNFTRYIDTFTEEEKINIQTTQKTIAAIEKQLFDTRRVVQKYLKGLGIDG